MLNPETLHHVSIPVADLERARAFYGGVLGLVEAERPPFDFPGAWYQVGDRLIHLIVGDHSTFRTDDRIDSRDAHFAIRVGNLRAAIDHLRSHGYREDAPDPLRRLRENLRGTAGFPQVYVLDPDRNVIEINAARLD